MTPPANIKESILVPTIGLKPRSTHKATICICGIDMATQQAMLAIIKIINSKLGEINFSDSFWLASVVSLSNMLFSIFFLNKKESGIVKITAIIPNKTYKNLQSNVLIKTAEIKVGQIIPEK